jgi:hypothetical protein
MTMSITASLGNLEVLDPSGKASGGKTDVGVDHVAYTYASLRDLVDTIYGSRRRHQTLLAHTPWSNAVALLQRS